MDIITILQLLTIALIFASLVERVREFRKQRDAERQAGEFLVAQVADAPEGATIILGAAKYRTKRSLLIQRDGITLQGAPNNLSKIIGEGPDPIIKVTDANGVKIRDMHIEMTHVGIQAQAQVRDTTDEPPLEDIKIIIPEDPSAPVDIADIMRRDYEAAGTSI